VSYRGKVSGQVLVEHWGDGLQASAIDAFWVMQRFCVGTKFQHDP